MARVPQRGGSKNTLSPDACAVFSSCVLLQAGLRVKAAGAAVSTFEAASELGARYSLPSFVLIQ